MFDRTEAPRRSRASCIPRFDEILTPEALAFVAELDGAFAGRRAELLAARRERGKRISAGETGRLPDRTPPRSATTRPGGSPPPAPGLEDRRVRDHRPDRPAR